MNVSSCTRSSAHAFGSSSPDTFSRVKPFHSLSVNFNFNFIPIFHSPQFLQLGMLDCSR